LLLLRCFVTLCRWLIRYVYVVPRCCLFRLGAVALPVAFTALLFRRCSRFPLPLIRYRCVYRCCYVLPFTTLPPPLPRYGALLLYRVVVTLPLRVYRSVLLLRERGERGGGGEEERTAVHAQVFCAAATHLHTGHVLLSAPTLFLYSRFRTRDWTYG